MQATLYVTEVGESSTQMSSSSKTRHFKQKTAKGTPHGKATMNGR